MADPFSLSRPDYGRWLIQVSREVVQQSLDLVDRTAPLVTRLGERPTPAHPAAPTEPEAK